MAIEAESVWEWAHGQMLEELFETLQLQFIAGRSHQEIADELKITRQAVFERVKRALKKLREASGGADCPLPKLC